MSGKHTVVYVHGKGGSADEAEHYINIVIWSIVYHFSRFTADMGYLAVTIFENFLTAE